MLPDHVLPHLTGTLERGPALRTRHPVRRVVLLLVPLPARRVQKRALADAALEPALSGVGPPVPVQIRTLQERPLADVADEAPPVLLCFLMAGQVLPEVVAPGKVPSAPGAQVAPPRCAWVVGPEVAPQARVLPELPTASGAGVEHPVLVPCLVLRQCEPAGESPTALDALQGRAGSRCVGELMLCPLQPRVETAATRLAGKLAAPLFAWLDGGC